MLLTSPSLLIILFIVQDIKQQTVSLQNTFKLDCRVPRELFTNTHFYGFCELLLFGVLLKFAIDNKFDKVAENPLIPPTTLHINLTSLV